MGIISLLCPILIFVTFGAVWVISMKFKKSLIIFFSAMIVSDLSLGYITKFLHSIFSFIPHLDPSWDGAWTNEQLIILFVGSIISIFLAKILRFTVPVYLAKKSHENSYEIVDILRPDIHVDSTTTTTTVDGRVTDREYDETRTASFKDGILSLWCEGYRNEGCGIYMTKLLEHNLDDFKKGQKLPIVSGFKLIHKPVINVI